MLNYRNAFIPIVLAAIIAGSTLVLGTGAYAGTTYYQSNNLVKDAEKLANAGDYTGAVSKYDQALKKWKWNGKKITPKKTTAQENAASNEILSQMDASFGKGEWQKCIDYLNGIGKDFPKYSQAQNRYSDCQKKLDEEAATQVATDAAAAKVEADRLAAEAAANATAAAKAKADAAAARAKDAADAKAAADAAARAAGVSDSMYATIRQYCGTYTGGNICGSCVSNNATCKASTDSVVASMTERCNNLKYELMNPTVAEMERAACDRGYADPANFVAQALAGR